MTCSLLQIDADKATVEVAYDGGETQFRGIQFSHAPLELQAELPRNNSWLNGGQYSLNLSTEFSKGYIHRKEYFLDLRLSRDLKSAVLEYNFLPTTTGGMYSQQILGSCALTLKK